MARHTKSSRVADVRYVIVLSVTVKGRTTELTSQEHKRAVTQGLFHFVGEGGLTEHEESAEIEVYSID